MKSRESCKLIAKKTFYESFKRIAFAFCAVLLGIFGVANAANLPAGYTELEYIESTGTQYIDTGIKPNDNTSIDIKFSTSSGTHFVFGSRKDTSGIDQQRFCLYVSNGNFNPQYGNTNYPPVGRFAVSTVYQVQMDKNGFVVDGITVQNFTSENFTGENNLILFGNNTNGTIVSAKNRIYYSKISENGTMVGNLIPCRRNSDNVVGMYDLVSRQFFTNQGTGDFTAGPAKCRNLFTTTSFEQGIYNSNADVSPDTSLRQFVSVSLQLPAGNYVLKQDTVPTGGYYARLVRINTSSQNIFLGGTSIISPYSFTLDSDGLVRFSFDKSESENGTSMSQDFTREQFESMKIQLEQGSTATDYAPYCVVNNEIKIATTKYNEEAFAGLVTTLNSAITKVTNIVDTTVAQANSIGTLATTKQDRPSDGDCPAGRKCLLVTGTDGQPHWYLIQE